MSVEYSKDIETQDTDKCWYDAEMTTHRSFYGLFLPKGHVGHDNNTLNAWIRCSWNY